MCKNSSSSDSMDLTPKSSTPWCSLFKCCRPTPPIAPTSESTERAAHNEFLQNKIHELAQKNSELESKLSSLSQEKTALETKLEKEKDKKKAAKKRRTTFKSKIADMSAKLKEDFGDDYDGALTSSEHDIDASSGSGTEKKMEK